MQGLILVVLCLAMFVAGLESGHKGVVAHTAVTTATVFANLELPSQLRTATELAKKNIP